MSNNINGGWIKQYRSVMQHDLYQAKPFDEFHAFIDLQFRASYETRQVKCYGTIRTLEPGDFLAGTRELAKAWGWTREKVIWFLKRLEKLGEITLQFTHQSTHRATLQYKLVNWQSYQGSHSTLHSNLDSNLHTLSKKVKKSKKDLTPTVIDTSILDPNPKLLPSSPNGSEVIEITPRIKMTRNSAKKLVELFGRESCEYYKLVCDDWLLANGKKKKDYAAFMRNWIRREKANSTGFYAKNRVPKQFSCAATVEANIEYYLKTEGFENGQTNDQKMLDFTEFREKNDDGK